MQYQSLAAAAAAKHMRPDDSDDQRTVFETRIRCTWSDGKRTCPAVWTHCSTRVVSVDEALKSASIAGWSLVGDRIVCGKHDDNSTEDNPKRLSDMLAYDKKRRLVVALFVASRKAAYAAEEQTRKCNPTLAAEQRKLATLLRDAADALREHPPNRS
jgi:hypothetical protein